MAYRAKKRIKYIGQFVIGLLLEIVAIGGFCYLTYYEFVNAGFLMEISHFVKLFSIFRSFVNSLGVVGGLIVHEAIYGAIAVILFVIGHKLVKGSRSYV